MKDVIPFDQYQRYKNASEIILLWMQNAGISNATVLEVGANEHKNLQKFLENAQITYLDIVVPESLMNDPSFVVGDATAMDFDDASFDWVVALDVYEHIPAERRKLFIDELYRVSKHGILFCAPYYTPEVEEVEKRVNSIYRSLYGQDYVWLKEHRECGLPHLDETIEYIKSKWNHFIVFGHGSLEIWEPMTSAHFISAAYNEVVKYRINLDEYYNNRLYHLDYTENVYRHFIVSIKNRELLDRIARWIDGRKTQSYSKNDQKEQHLKVLNSALHFLGLLNVYFAQMSGKVTELGIMSLINKGLQIEKIESKLELLARRLESDQNEKYQYIDSLKNHIDSLENELGEKNNTIHELQSEISRMQSEITEKDLKIASLVNAVAEKDEHTKKLQELAESMRMKNRIKKMVFMLPKKSRKNMDVVFRLVLRNPRYIIKGFREIRRNGINGLRERINAVRLMNDGTKNYNNNSSMFESAGFESDVQFRYQPLISILMPVYNVEPKWLDLAIKSVQRQNYTNWELCIVDDGSTNNATVTYLRRLDDPKIKVTFSPVNQNIVAASNLAAEMASGEYIALLDHDDELMPNALYEVVEQLQEEEYDLLYSDEDKIDAFGERKTPLYKPDWSPDLLRSQMYLGHLLVFRKSLFDKIGGFRKGFEGAQDYDLVLRITEMPGCKIKHISKVLYSWREIPSSTSMNPHSKPYAHFAGQNAVREHLERIYGANNAWVEETKYLFVYNARYKLPENTKASIIIPTKDKIELLEPCIESIVQLTDYPDYEILILDNNSEEDETKKWFMKIVGKYNHVKVINAFYPFNWSKLNNHGIRESSGDVFVFLNNDTKVITRDWLTRLAEKAIRSDVGTVGALLLFEDETIQHAGVVIGMGGWADHVFKGSSPVHFGSPFISPMVTRNVSANTGACLAISRKTIEKIGGFDEEFIVCGSDVEISIRAMKHGLFNIYDPNVRLIHYESKTRSSTVPEKDFEMSALHYRSFWEQGDPYFNKNLSLQHLMPTIKQVNPN